MRYFGWIEFGFLNLMPRYCAEMNHGPFFIALEEHKVSPLPENTIFSLKKYMV
jgi:hypothetical protein